MTPMPWITNNMIGAVSNAVNVPILVSTLELKLQRKRSVTLAGQKAAEFFEDLHVDKLYLPMA